MRNARSYLRFDIALLLLHRIRAPVERQYEKVDYKAQDDDSKSGMGKEFVYDKKYLLKEQVQRTDQNLIDRL